MPVDFAELDEGRISEYLSQKIAGIFNVSTKSDVQWVKNQVRKEQYGDSNSQNYQWKKTSWK
ncbi:hypothetical protein [uncultured Prevotella sp.]|uniref:hypothetical protein n=1 Tax=uncultured Prevotella sp. TaxID=159272 RepID=UPI002586CEEC|nr:hypothetical protein [uncultured Prevotella sp.]